MLSRTHTHTQALGKDKFRATLSTLAIEYADAVRMVREYRPIDCKGDPTFEEFVSEGECSRV